MLGWDVLVPDSDADPEEDPYPSHDPAWASKTIEDFVFESHLVEQATEERTSAHPEALAHDQEAREGRAASDTDDSCVGAVALVVHPECKGKTADHAANEYEVQPVGWVGAGVEDVADDGGGAADVQRDLVSSFECGYGSV